ncbi:hypothetical protein [Streptomyces himalayensis]|uniref:Nucleoside phosphorylase domain-containing protein n=1 Tax=Streptomyces himalayensis subsp. himalayensis TaxID=2756131 RepID=A0A7W0DT35_9ACTN|nr:hypothetical protein [Streptomyces himalayensis]MBA2950355.1 hypothetical protein [Streptomyces himalayensis subsp. himalayensis]
MAILEGHYGHARVAIMTIIEEEFKAVQREFQALYEIEDTGIYSPVAGEGGMEENGPVIHPFVVARANDRATDPAGELPRDLYEYFSPEIFVLVGIAGGVQREKVKRWKRDGTKEMEPKGPRPGDVVVAKFIHFYDYAKNVPSGRRLRYFAIDHPCSDLIARHARTVGRGDLWKQAGGVKRPKRGTSTFWDEEIVVTNQLAGNPGSREQIDMLATFDNAMAVEMESIGIARELHHLRKTVHYDPLWMCIRGISDTVPAERPTIGGKDNTAERERWKNYAAAVAASFARSVIERILKYPRPGVEGDSGAPRWTFS